MREHFKLKRLWPRALAVVKWLGPQEFTTLVLVAIAAVSLWSFLELAGEVLEGSTKAYDHKILMALRDPTDNLNPRGPLWLQSLGRDFTSLGGVGVLTFVTLSVSGFLVITRKYHEAYLILAAVGGGWVLSTVLKGFFDRPRPDIILHGTYVITASFPSGHSMMSTITYLTLGALLTRVQPEKRIKIYILTLSIILPVLVGLSRVYLAVHWPTDVLAGWIIGVIWALLCWLIARWLQYRGSIQNDRNEKTHGRELKRG